MINKQEVALVAINPNAYHNTSTYILKNYAYKNVRIKNEINISLHFFDALVPPQSNAVDLYTRLILQNHCRVIGFSAYCWNIEIITQITRQIKLVSPETIILLGGPEATGNYKKIFNRYSEIDFIICGEGEISFQKFLKHTFFGLSINEVPNLVYRINDGLINNDCVELECLDEIPSIFASASADPNEIGGALYSFETKRGCEYACSYCLHHKGSHNIREYSLNYVYNELERLLNSDLTYIWITDPCFNQNEQRSIAILDYIELNNHKNIEFGFEIRGETLSEQFINKICRMPCIRFIALGLQTLTLKSLAAVNRIFDLNKFGENVRLIRSKNESIKIHIDLIFGLPLDTIDGYKHSINYALNLGCNIFTQPLKVLPGSSLFDEYKKYGIVVNETPPYEVLFSSSFNYTDMCNAKKINTIINLFQCHKDIKCLLDEYKNTLEINYADLFEVVGKCLWKKDNYFLFSNYHRVSVLKIYNILHSTLKELYPEVSVNLHGSTSNDVVQIDWGSISPQYDY